VCDTCRIPRDEIFENHIKSIYNSLTPEGHERLRKYFNLEFSKSDIHVNKDRSLTENDAQEGLS
jgi:hypothetical protein